MNNKEKGKLGEDLAQKFLEDKNYEILERNWRYGSFGEIDIIASDKDILVFVEVKTRTSNICGTPFEAINAKKMTQIQNTAQAYIMQSNKKYKGYRIDAISVMLTTKEIQHIKNVF